MKSITLILIIVILLGISSVILFKNWKESRVIGAELTQEEITFNKTDLKVCCFYKENNEVKACRILKRFDCSLCEDKCKQK